LSLPLTPARLAALYEALRAFPPFCRWKLPPTAEVQFHVVRQTAAFGDHYQVGDVHHIRVSAAKNGHLETTLATVAHEMVHIHQCRLGQERTHGAYFKRCATLICRRFGWDERSF
jgi:hypothetical protein